MTSLFASAAACSPGEADPAGELSRVTGRPAPVLLIVIDSLRADHVRLLGEDDAARDTTPFLRELARHAIVFENAYTTASWTRPAVASLLSGRLPASHGCDGPQASLPAQVTLLPELLAAQGYDTQAVVASPHLAPEFGFARGWNGYRLQPARPQIACADARLLREAIDETLASMAPPPFLLYLHWMDPHAPWGSHHELDSYPLYGGTFDGSSQALRPFRDRPPSAANRQRAIDLYDGEIRWLDERLRELFATPDLGGELAASWIIVTSDHGTALWDRGRLGHAGSLQEEILRVPLLLRPPGGLSQPRRVTARFSLIDLAPTLLELLGLLPCADFEGVSWAGHLLGRGEAPERAVLACERGRDGSERAALIDGSRKLVADLGSGDVELIDLQLDPAGLQPQPLPASLADGAPGPAAELREQLLQALSAARARRPPEALAPADADLPVDVRRQLQALGEFEGDG